MMLMGAVFVDLGLTVSEEVTNLAGVKLEERGAVFSVVVTIGSVFPMELRGGADLFILLGPLSFDFGESGLEGMRGNSDGLNDML